MPRRLPVRPAKLIGNLFVIFVLLIIGMIYYSYVGVIWGPRIVCTYFLFLHFCFRKLLGNVDACGISRFLLYANVVFLLGYDH